MSQHMIESDFTNESIIYCSDDKEYACAYQDEIQTITSGKYEVVEMKLFVVCKKEKQKIK
jgi:hypothetical protein